MKYFDDYEKTLKTNVLIALGSYALKPGAQNLLYITKREALKCISYWLLISWYCNFLKDFHCQIMLDQNVVIGLAVASFVVMAIIVVLSACFCPSTVTNYTTNAMRYDRYGRPIVVVATTENGHTGVPHLHTEFAHHHTGFGHHANGEFNFGSPRLDLHQDPNSGAAVPPPFASPPSYTKFWKSNGGYVL